MRCFRYINNVFFNFDKKLAGYILTLCLGFTPGILWGEPIFVTNNDLWDEHTTIYIANVNATKEHNKNIIYLETLHQNSVQRLQQFTSSDISKVEYLDIIYATIHNQAHLHAVTKGDQSTPSFLICYSLSEPQNSSLYSLKRNFCTAYLSLGQSNAGLSHRLSVELRNESLKFHPQYLCLTGNGFELTLPNLSLKTSTQKPIETSYATLFDISKPGDNLKPITLFEHGFQGKLTQLNRAVYVALQNKITAFILGGIERTGCIGFLYLPESEGELYQNKLALYRTTQAAPIHFVLPLDTLHTGVADQLLLCDKNHLWNFNLNDPKKGFALIHNNLTLPRLCPAPYAGQGIFVVNDLKLPEQSLYCLNNASDKLKTSLKLNTSPSTNTLAKLQLGNKILAKYFNSENLHSIYLRSGRILLVPTLLSSKQTPTLIDLTQENKIFQPMWQFIVQAKEVNELMQTKLLWDAKTKQEVLVTMNEKGDINILTAALTRDKYHRQSFRACQK